MDFILAAATRPFAIAIGLMLAFAAIEVVLALVGQGLSDTLDSILPDPDAIDGSALGGALSFFGVGSAPLLAIIVAFLTIFGLTGYVVQAIAGGIGGYLPAVVAAVPALLAAVFGTRRFARLIGRLLPSVETTAVSVETFVGRTARITLGEARVDAPTQARLRDRYGQVHYVLVEPERDGVALRDGELVLLVRQRRHLFTAVPAPDEMLLEADDGR